MSEATMDEVLQLVEDAQSKGKFKLEEVIKGHGNPEDIVEIYLDSDAAYKLSLLADELDATTVKEELDELETKLATLKERLLKSKLTFHMRGIDQGLIETIEKQARDVNADNEDENNWLIDYFCGLVAANVYKVVDADGNIDDSVFKMEDANKWRQSLPAEGWIALTETMQKLTLATGYFKGLTDAGFLPKS